MNVLLLLFAFLPIIVVPAHARILSESAGGKLALIITIYGRKPPSPPPPPSSSPPTHHSTIGATASPPPAPPRTKPIGQGTNYERTRSPPPSPKPAPSHGQLGRSTSPCNRIISMVTEHSVRKPRSPPPSLKLLIGSDYGNTRSPQPPPKPAPSHGQLGSSTSPCNRIISTVTEHCVRKSRSPPPSLKLLIGSDYGNTRSPPPPPKPAPSHGQLGSSTSPCNRIISTITEYCVRKLRSPPPSLKLLIGSDYGNTRSPPPPPKAAPSHGQLGSTSPWNKFISIATDSGWIKLPRSSPSIVQDK